MKRVFLAHAPRIPGPEDFKTSSGISLCIDLTNHINRDTLLKYWHPSLIKVMERIGDRAHKIDGDNLLNPEDIEPADENLYHELCETHEMQTVEDIETFHALYSSAIAYKDLRGALEFERHLLLTGDSPFQLEGMTQDAIDFTQNRSNDTIFMVFNWLIINDYPELSERERDFIFSNYIRQVERDLQTKGENTPIHLENLPPIITDMRNATRFEKVQMDLAGEQHSTLQ